MKATLTIDLSEVIDEVAMTTGYIGFKLIGSDPGAYERISTTDSDTAMLWRFTQECRARICSDLRHCIDAEGMEGDEYRIDLDLPDNYDRAMLPALETDIYSCFANHITGCWLRIAGSDKAGYYETKAKEDIESVAVALNARCRPIRNCI